MDGYEATRQLRRRLDINQTPIVAMTAHAKSSASDRCLPAGMNDHIAKPIEIDELYVALIRWLPVKRGKIADILPAAAPGAASEFPRPKRIAGINLEAGLARVNGKWDLYRNMLERFFDRRRGAPEEIAEAIRAGRYGHARDQVHAIKGVAGNLGAEAVLASAKALERQLHDDHPDIARQQQALAEFSAALREVFKAIEALPRNTAAQPSPAAPASPPKPDAVAEILRAMSTTLDSDLGEARRQYQRLAGLFPAGQYHKEYQRLGQALFDYDTEEAQLILCQIAEMLDITLEQA